ncbi:dTMP kinase [Mycoplasma iguanae]|uniref:Thymidylate kinase n=1 Tax=Mycoplasma iguanae TaxID=292461 RepID=A0ABY5R9V7_9MOLU|nr:dTMP kinase [Mycoplasma iguanae]UVD81770.1 dTMP kinase [Mycoplasma iguanae]
MFITFEGLDGSGKTTIIELIGKKITENFPTQQFIITREPGGKDLAIAEDIRSIILNINYEIDTLTEAVLFAASRRLHLNKIIKPALAANKLVLCDRYVDSSLAYQGGGGKAGEAKILELNKLVIDNLWPEITFLFKISPEEAFNRILKADTTFDRIEKKSLSFFQRVSDSYNKLAAENPNRYVIIDATENIETVLEKVWVVLESRVFNAIK